jgi:hypothetical protein
LIHRIYVVCMPGRIYRVYTYARTYARTHACMRICRRNMPVLTPHPLTAT